MADTRPNEDGTVFETLEIRGDYARVKATVTRGQEVVTAEGIIDVGVDCQLSKQIAAVEARGGHTGLLLNRLGRMKAERLARAQQRAELDARKKLAPRGAGATDVR